MLLTSVIIATTYTVLLSIVIKDYRDLGMKWLLIAELGIWAWSLIFVIEICKKSM